MNKTNIEWTTFSANPLQYRRKSDGKTVWACVKTSPGCAHCYSEQIALRWERGKLFTTANMEEVEPFLCEKELKEMLTRKTCAGVAVSGSRCFVGDMTDLFGEWVPDELLDRLFAVFALRSDVTFQALTKRAERMAKYMATGRQGRVNDAAHIHFDRPIWLSNNGKPDGATPWPLDNLHLGVSVEDQKRADERIPFLLKTPAAVRFLSVEPLLSAVDLSKWLNNPIITGHPAWRRDPDRPNVADPLLHWVICGGESGPGARSCDIEWIRGIAKQCNAAGVPCFVKQLGSVPVEVILCGLSPGSIKLDTYDMPGGEPDDDIRWIALRDKKGGDPEEWPADLRVREFPVMEGR